MKNINITDKKAAISREKLFAAECKNAGIFASVRGSQIAAVSFKPREQTIMLSTGASIKESISRSPVTPTAFLIKTVLPRIRSKPSFI